MYHFKSISFLCLLLFFFLSCNCNNKKIEKNKKEIRKTITKSTIIPPIPKLDIKYSNYLINPQKDTVLIHETGSIINIPKNAFLDVKGNIINKKVKIEYREFANAFDTYLAGIPMTYDTLGQSMIFETAGMLEINASSNNTPVYVNPKNKIKIDMNSFQKGNQYNLYQLDESSGKWNSIGKDKVEEKKYVQEIAKLPKVPPIPKIATPVAFTISDSINGTNSELAMYKNVLFEPISGGKCGFSPTEIKINELEDGKYELNFIFKGRAGKLNQDTILVDEQKCICYLAFKKGKDYDNAMKVYQKKYASKIAKRKKLKEQLEKEWVNYLQIESIYRKAGMLQYFNSGSTPPDSYEGLTNAKKIERTFEIMNFGFINCDVPSTYPQGANLIASFKDKKGVKLNLKNIVLVEKGRNALFRYGNNIKFNPSEENLLWGLTQSGQLAYFNSEDFKRIDKTKGKYVFKMNIHHKELKTAEDIANVLFK